MWLKGAAWLAYNRLCVELAGENPARGRLSVSKGKEAGKQGRMWCST